MRVGKLSLHLGPEVSRVACGCRVETSDAIGRKLWNGNSGQDADDRNNDQKLDEGKTFSVSDFVKHVFSPFFVLCSLSEL